MLKIILLPLCFQKILQQKRVEVIILPSSPEDDIPQWHKEIIDKRLKDYKQSPDDVTDFDIFCDELEKENL